MMVATTAERASSSNKPLIKKIVGLIVVAVVCVTVIFVVVKVLRSFGGPDDKQKEKAKFDVRVLTNNGAVGMYGPSILKYGGFLKQEVRVSPNQAGIQLWTVPTSGIWSIEARGASGADGILAGSAGNKKRGGYGAVAKAKFQLYAGKVLSVLVGHEGLRDFTHSHRPGGGGGGTFVVHQDGKPLIIAGGGGGGGIPRATTQTRGGGGRKNDEPVSAVSGSDGNGGRLLDTSDASETVITNSTGHHNVIAGAGGGMYGSGVGYGSNWGGKSFVGGGTGGEALPTAESFPHGETGRGGFGGGGAAGLLPGAGGGYSGGGVVGCFLTCNGKEGGSAEGGSSYIDSSGISPSFKADTNKGPGRVYLRLMAEDVEET
ncbi:tyrosine-protein kinase receptor-like [Montipora foliosa]|uniref:tyrosine-protein kinase receptor-like n=1 Tax=Montipora foliosa TaxID=591990 RepID=UPI0035F1BA54